MKPEFPVMACFDPSHKRNMSARSKNQKFVLALVWQSPIDILDLVIASPYILNQPLYSQIVFQLQQMNLNHKFHTLFKTFTNAVPIHSVHKFNNSSANNSSKDSNQNESKVPENDEHLQTQSKNNNKNTQQNIQSPQQQQQQPLSPEQQSIENREMIEGNENNNNNSMQSMWKSKKSPHRRASSLPNIPRNKS